MPPNTSSSGSNVLDLQPCSQQPLLHPTKTARGDDGDMQPPGSAPESSRPTEKMIEETPQLGPGDSVVVDQLSQMSPVDSGLGKVPGTPIDTRQKPEGPGSAQVPSTSTQASETEGKWWHGQGQEKPRPSFVQTKPQSYDHPHAPVLAKKQCWWCAQPLKSKENWLFAFDCTFCSHGCRSHRLAMSDDHPRVVQHRSKMPSNVLPRSSPNVYPTKTQTALPTPAGAGGGAAPVAPTTTCHDAAISPLRTVAPAGGGRGSARWFGY